MSHTAIAGVDKKAYTFDNITDTAFENIINRSHTIHCFI